MKLSLVSITLLLMASFTSYSQVEHSGLYAVGAVGYAKNDINDYNHDELTYKLNFGYVLSDQWSIEVGYNALGDSGLNNDELATSNATFETNDYNITAIRISALGRARNQHGELFYRVGVMQVNAERTYAIGGDVCEGTDSLIETISSASICFNDDDQIAATIGLGFDFNITNYLQLRLELEYNKGEDDYSSQAALVGLRVNF